MKNPLTLEAFAEWLEKQPQDGEYVYGSVVSCAICQYMDDIGLRFTTVGESTWFDANGEHQMPSGFDEAVKPFPRTFGAAAKRARALIARDTSLGMRAEDVS